MRQTNYLHNDANFEEHGNAMAYPQGLWLIPGNDPMEGHDARAFCKDQLAIQQCLLSINYCHAQSIIIFASPQILKEGSLWAPLLQKLA
jgi:hypothetical protein